MPPEMIGPYRVERLLGQTAFGAAYLAHDDRLHRRVLLKFPTAPPDEPAHGERVSEELVREGQLLAQLNHPAVVTVFDIGQHDGKWFIAVELVEGAKLTDVFAKEPMARSRLVRLMSEVADAIHYIHRRGYFHLHLKPDNLLVDASGRPKIDGLSFATHESQSSVRGGRIIGTPAYMAPEQVAAESERFGAHTDVWALGIILYEGLAGRPPFSAINIEVLFHDILQVDPVEPRKIDPSIPEELQKICSKCLEKEPHDRYPSVAAFGDELRRWLIAQDLAATSTRSLVFVSHSTKDRGFVEQEIIGFLERHGVETWYSINDVPSSSYWERTTLKGLEMSDWFLLVMSPRSAESEWVKDEVHWAVDRRPRRIIPVLIETCDPRDFHIRLARIQHVDFREDVERARQNLLNTLRQAGVG
jgi:serine/threonine protein kinase